ncbi:unnamed protein product, partial [Adineta ricciae]
LNGASFTPIVTTVKIYKVFNLAQIEFIFKLCPLITYLELDDWSNINLEILVQFVVMKSPSSLQYFTISDRKYHSDFMEKLKNRWKFSTIKFQKEKIYLQLNR